MQKIDRDLVYERYASFPSFRYDEASDTDLISFPATMRTEILEVRNALSAADRFTQMATATVKLATLLRAERLLFMGASATPWRYQHSAFSPARLADEFLEAQQVDRAFAGGLLPDLQELPQWLPHLLWLVATNASLPEVYFIDPAQQLLGTFCRYGNLHLYLLEAAAAEAFRRFAAEEALRLITGEGCRDHDDGVQSGRQTVVDPVGS